ncbi:MAG: polysaccharide deacetylase family protein [Bacillota bacterium]|nr:polysaccharide deacetylase family protein [Bacillota bacterium]
MIGLTELKIAEGHVIGNHSWSHPRLSEIAASDLAAEIEKTEYILEVTTGLRTLLMRPPYGAVNGDTLAN